MNAGPTACDSCNTIKLNAIFLNDSNWVKQENYTYTSDITMDIIHAGNSVDRVYAMYIANGTPYPKIFPEISGDYMGGSIRGSVNLSKDKGTCVLTFEFSNEEHFGEMRHGSLLPFSSVEIEVMVQN